MQLGERFAGVADEVANPVGPKRSFVADDVAQRLLFDALHDQHGKSPIEIVRAQPDETRMPQRARSFRCVPEWSGEVFEGVFQQHLDDHGLRADAAFQHGPSALNPAMAAASELFEVREQPRPVCQALREEHPGRRSLTLHVFGLTGNLQDDLFGGGLEPNFVHAVERRRRLIARKRRQLPWTGVDIDPEDLPPLIQQARHFDFSAVPWNSGTKQTRAATRRRPSRSAPG